MKKLTTYSYGNICTRRDTVSIFTQFSPSARTGSSRYTHEIDAVPIPTAVW